MSPQSTPIPEPYSSKLDPSEPANWVKRVFRWSQVDSTNEAAFRALEQGQALDGDAFLALEQTHGRGRRGNRWCSKPGLGLYSSFVLRPGLNWPGPMVTITAGLALQDAVEHLGLANSRLKWPNDLLVQGRKLAGILVESRAWSAKDPVYVLGIGVNVAQMSFPEELSAERPVVSLAQLGLNATLEDVQHALFASLGTRLGQARMAPAALARDFLAALRFGTATVHVQVAAETVSGQISGLEFDRGMEISSPDGRKRWIPLEHIRSVSSTPPDTLLAT